MNRRWEKNLVSMTKITIQSYVLNPNLQTLEWKPEIKLVFVPLSVIVHPPFFIFLALNFNFRSTLVLAVFLRLTG